MHRPLWSPAHLEVRRRSRGDAVAWTLAYGHHEDRTPIYGYEPTREAAMAAFAKSWRGSSAVKAGN